MGICLSPTQTPLRYAQFMITSWIFSKRKTRFVKAKKASKLLFIRNFLLSNDGCLHNFRLNIFLRICCSINQNYLKVFSTVVVPADQVDMSLNFEQFISVKNSCLSQTRYYNVSFFFIYQTLTHFVIPLRFCECVYIF